MYCLVGYSSRTLIQLITFTSLGEPFEIRENLLKMKTVFVEYMLCKIRTEYNKKGLVALGKRLLSALAPACSLLRNGVLRISA